RGNSAVTEAAVEKLASFNPYQITTAATALIATNNKPRLMPMLDTRCAKSDQTETHLSCGKPRLLATAAAGLFGCDTIIDRDRQIRGGFAFAIHSGNG